MVQGSSFRFEPLAPAIDRLEHPVVLAELPAAPFPEQTFRSRVRRYMAGKRADRHSHEQRLHWRFYDTVDQVLTLVSPQPYQPVSALGFELRGSKKNATPSPGIFHPYQLKAAFELLAELPETFAAERHYLDDLLSSILIAYRTQISQRTIGSMSFFREAQDYFISGYRLEKTILKSIDGEAQIAACQQIYDTYHHGINYYVYALVTRESIEIPNSVFMMFCNALYFKARIEWNGALRSQANSKKLPTRNWILFFVLRDRTVLKQHQNNTDYAKQLRELLRAFPEGVVPKAAPHHKPTARSAKLDRPAAVPAKAKIAAQP